MNDHHPQQMLSSICSFKGFAELFNRSAESPCSVDCHPSCFLFVILSAALGTSCPQPERVIFPCVSSPSPSQSNNQELEVGYRFFRHNSPSLLSKHQRLRPEPEPIQAFIDAQGLEKSFSLIFKVGDLGWVPLAGSCAIAQIERAFIRPSPERTPVVDLARAAKLHVS